MCGEQVVEQYSRLGLAKDVYVMCGEQVVEQYSRLGLAKDVYVPTLNTVQPPVHHT
jgi:hypothetical protein